MRDLLFRGKSRENGDWYEGNLEINKYYRYSSEEKDYRIVDRNCGIDDDGFAYYQSGCDESCDPETIGQFTGFFDKNGTKIFEGDIIEFGSRNLVVWWDQEKFQWRAKAVLGIPIVIRSGMILTWGGFMQSCHQSERLLLQSSAISTIILKCWRLRNKNEGDTF